jgi:hypothetical protein
MKERKEKNRILKGFYRDYYNKQISVYCHNCQKWHHHGAGEGSRVPHCASLIYSVNKMIPNPHYNPKEYDIQVFTKTELKPFKNHILDLILNDKEKEALKLNKVLC